MRRQSDPGEGEVLFSSEMTRCRSLTLPTPMAVQWTPLPTTAQPQPQPPSSPPSCAAKCLSACARVQHLVLLSAAVIVILRTFAGFPSWQRAASKGGQSMGENGLTLDAQKLAMDFVPTTWEAPTSKLGLLAAEYAGLFGGLSHPSPPRVPPAWLKLLVNSTKAVPPLFPPAVHAGMSSDEDWVRLDDHRLLKTSYWDPRKLRDGHRQQVRTIALTGEAERSPAAPYESGKNITGVSCELVYRNKRLEQVVVPGTVDIKQLGKNARGVHYFAFRTYRFRFLFCRPPHPDFRPEFPPPEEPNSGWSSIASAQPDFALEPPRDAVPEFVLWKSARTGSRKVKMRVRQLADPRTHARTLTVCVRPWWGAPNPHTGVFDHVVRLMEFVETYKVLGVDYFSFYESAFPVSFAVKKALRVYKEEGLLEVVPWNFQQHGLEPFQSVWDYAQEAQTNDCVLRHSDSKYVLMIDTDEFIFPSDPWAWGPNPLPAILNKLIHFHPLSGSLGFRNHWTFMESPDDAEKEKWDAERAIPALGRVPDDEGIELTGAGQSAAFKEAVAFHTLATLDEERNRTNGKREGERAAHKHWLDLMVSPRKTLITKEPGDNSPLRENSRTKAAVIPWRVSEFLPGFGEKDEFVAIPSDLARMHHFKSAQQAQSSDSRTKTANGQFSITIRAQEINDQFLQWEKVRADGPHYYLSSVVKGMTSTALKMAAHTAVTTTPRSSSTTTSSPSPQPPSADSSPSRGATEQDANAKSPSQQQQEDGGKRPQWTGKQDVASTGREVGVGGGGAETDKRQATMAGEGGKRTGDKRR
ncbi:unnamed protein product [Vitrella brassicaformis CCMP3155]|uniref:Glycosyltransferase family 92 protein n=1 Tax=Vitrella brassicaformis (strain CCMP3155) TaxID=1169540 RepID=A0A0G4EIN9_VITBC|nr:unnamed protein product [Vitrella brassicaformis CCMP3155]|eukprot:CEL95875.1 unnamed protein product [Vitrella brassicaformis CCMP3155]